MEAVMRIRRTIIAPIILAISTAGALVAGPVVALSGAVAPVGAMAAGHVAPNVIVMHG
jgi:hypothetical protein